MDAVLQTLTSIGRETARIVLHAPCIVCGRELPWRDRTASCCAVCWASLPRIKSETCSSCALPLATINDAGEGACAPLDTTDDAGGGACAPLAIDPLLRCIECSVDPLPLDWCDAWGHYRGSLASVLRALKFRRHDFFAGPLAELMHHRLDARGDFAFDAIVPVPMHRAKLRRRGYNQAELLARSLATRLRVTCEPSLLARTGERATQSKLNRLERRANVRGAFVATPRAEGRSILIVDDVCTTGETLRACAAALFKQEASRVCAIVVAKA